MATTDVDAKVDLWLDKAPTGGGTSLSLVAAEGRHHRIPARAYLRRSPILQVQRFLNGTETVLGTVNLSVPGGSYSPGEVLHLRLLVDGTSLSGKAWFDAAAEPSTWQLQVTDATAQPSSLEDGVHAYLSTSATNSPVALSVDNLLATEA